MLIAVVLAGVGGSFMAVVPTITLVSQRSSAKVQRDQTKRNND
jgi:hypothetical protein